jgi:hypothetical protein
MNIIQNLPDDIILHIYTKCLKRYRFYDGKLIKLIDINKYKFLEKYIGRRIKKYRITPSNDGEIRYSIQYQLSNLIDINRKKKLHIDDDMICIELTINDSSVIYDVNRFRLKKKEDLNINKMPSIYYKGDYDDYDWEVVSYTYKI